MPIPKRPEKINERLTGARALNWFRICCSVKPEKLLKKFGAGAGAGTVWLLFLAARRAAFADALRAARSGMPPGGLAGAGAGAD